MMNAKTGDWWMHHPERARSNNSCLLLRSSTTKAEFDEILKSVKDYGEPGFIWTDDLDDLYNPCVPADGRLHTSKGLITMGELYNSEEEVDVVIDTRAGKGDDLDLTQTGITTKQATKVHLTQKNAKVYNVTLNNGAVIPATANHEFPTIHGRKKLKELTLNDVLLLQSEEGSWGDDQAHGMGYDTGVLIGKYIKGEDDTEMIEQLQNEVGSGIPEAIWQGDRTTVIAWLKGLFDTCGNTHKTETSVTHLSLCGTINNIELFRDIQVILQNFGILSYVQDTDITTLTLSSAESFKLNEIVKVVKEIDTANMEPTDYTAKIVGITYRSTEDVYCLYQEETNTIIVNGVVTGQCVEIGLTGYSITGMSGFGVCNLTEVNGGKSTSKEVFLKQCKLAAIMGTLQAGYTDFKYVGSATKDIVEYEALLGVSITGWMNNPNILFDDDILDEGAAIVDYWNGIVSKIIGIKPAARMLTVKPSGNTSTLLGTASGIHGEHSKRYLRHVQFNKTTEIAQLFIKHNPDMVENSVYSDNDIVVAFPVSTPEGSIYKKDLLGVKQLQKVVNAKRYWVDKGTYKDRGLNSALSHNVSNTITVDDWDEVGEFIYDNRYDLGGVSLLASTGDKAYTQAPFTEVLSSDQILSKYGTESMFTSALIEAGLNAFNMDLWNALNTAQGYGEQLTEGSKDLLKRDFVRRFKKFAVKFNDEDECASCIKDVYNLHKWWKIERNVKPIDWEHDLHEKVYTEVGENVATACAGGKCEI